MVVQTERLADMKQRAKYFVNRHGKSIIRVLVVIVLAFAINAIVLVATGKSVQNVYSSLWKGAFSDLYNVARTIRWATPLMFTSLAFIVSARAGVFNCGAEGQLLMGAFAATWVGFTFPQLPSGLLIILCCIVAMIAGAIWSVIAGLIMIKFRANIIVVTLMLNYIAALFTEYLTRYPFNEGGSLAMGGSTEYIAEHACLPIIVKGSQVTTALFVGLLACIIVFIFCKYTMKGYETRIIGANERFALFSGINVNSGKMLTFVLCGLIAGLGGAMETLGIYHRFLIGSIDGFGFDGIVVALLARSNPLLVPIGSLFMGALISGSITVEMFGGVPKSMTDILMGIIIMLITVQKVGIVDGLKRLKEKLLPTSKEIEDDYDAKESV